jgi:GNAT superfamily N-acetyltransferase
MTDDAESGELDLPGGLTIPFRPIEPGDAAALQRFHSQLSERSIYQRFIEFLPRLSDDRAHYFTNVDGRDRFALVALDPLAPGEIAGVVRFDRDPDSDRAEYAAIVLDRWQGKGIGYALSRHLAAAARRRGVRTLYAIVLPENATMLTLLHDLGYPSRRRFEDGIERVELDLADA